MAKTMRISYFGHDSSDAAIRKRIRVFQSYGYEIDGFMNRRRNGPDPEWNNYELGETENGAYFNRILSVFKGAFRATKQKQKLAASDLIIARNLDMLATAFLTLRLTSLKKPVVYECLDIHRLLCRQDAVGWMARKTEGFLLRRSLGGIVSAIWRLVSTTEGKLRSSPNRSRTSLAFLPTARAIDVTSPRKSMATKPRRSPRASQ